MDKKGTHLIIDAYGCKQNLDNVKKIKNLLNDLVDMVGMKKLSNAKVVFYEAEKPINSGVTGIILLNESHISIHTYSNRDEIYMDIFSCRPFDPDNVKKYLKDFFKIDKLKQKVIRRGKIL